MHTTTQFDLVEKLLYRGLAGTRADIERAFDLALAVLRYGHDCLTDDDNRWLGRTYPS